MRGRGCIRGEGLASHATQSSQRNPQRHPRQRGRSVCVSWSISHRAWVGAMPMAATATAVPARIATSRCCQPYLRRRLVREDEVVAAALQAHGLADAEKFIQEVFWRGYFKGWLERRPAIWSGYRDGLAQDSGSAGFRPPPAPRSRAGRSRCQRPRLLRRLGRGTGRNRLSAQPRADVVRLHLDTSASGCPGGWGADSFYRHLLDGDPASNTLSWRWVAGLHTRGKPYAARAWNIAKFTNGRLQPHAKAIWRRTSTVWNIWSRRASPMCGRYVPCRRRTLRCRRRC